VSAWKGNQEVGRDAVPVPLMFMVSVLPQDIVPGAVEEKKCVTPHSDFLIGRRQPTRLFRSLEPRWTKYFSRKLPALCGQGVTHFPQISSETISLRFDTDVRDQTPPLRYH